jgi:hypothetical protein
MHLLLKNAQKMFLNGFSTKFFKLLDLVDVYQYHSPQKLQNSTRNFNFQVYLKIFILCDIFILTQV